MSTSILRLVPPVRKVSLSDQSAIEETDLSIREARRYLAADMRFLAGEWSARARTAARRIHDPFLKAERVRLCERLEIDGTLADAGGGK